MPHLLLNVSTKNYSEIIGNGATYRVPLYQRDYSWSDDQWSDLWLDLLGLETEKNHYLGYLVLQKNTGDKDFWIIDGQQRLATLSILALAVEGLLKEWSEDQSLEGMERKNNQNRAETLHHRFLGNFSASKLSTASKLFLNKNNDTFYNLYLLNFNPPHKAARLKPSQRLLYRAYEFFYQKLKERFPKPDGAGLAAFLESEIAPHLIFTTIEVGDEFSAYKVFETLNARGVRLSPSDLLKNYLFSIGVQDDATDFVEAEQLWQNISDKIGDGDIPAFIRDFWNSQHGFVRSAELYRAVRSTVTTREKVFVFLRELDAAADLYAAFRDFNNPLWEKAQKYPLKLIEMFRLTACYPLLMVAHLKLRPKEFTSLLEEIIILTFRRIIIGNQNVNELELVFHRCALGVFAGNLTTSKQICTILRPLYVKDQEFQAAFSMKAFPYPHKKDVIRYILAELENHINGNSELPFDGQFSLEHIMPQTSSSVWDTHFTRTEQVEYMNRLANFSPLETEINEKLKNDWSFTKKAVYYKKSSYALTKRLSNFSDWSPATIDQRQEEMAKIAVAIWKSAFDKKPSFVEKKR